ncbi:MAG: plasmid stabilization protein [Candidatus Dormibacteria bacterium]
MPSTEWIPKRERQYDHVRQSLKRQGRSEKLSQEIAARTVNKQRARSGESDSASRTSIQDISSGRRGGLRSHRGPVGRTRDQLYQEARSRGIKGRSQMTKAQLLQALGSR